MPELIFQSYDAEGTPLRVSMIRRDAPGESCGFRQHWGEWKLTATYVRITLVGGPTFSLRFLHWKACYTRIRLDHPKPWDELHDGRISAARLREYLDECNVSETEIPVPHHA